MFNTLRYAKMLEDVGFSRDQSETSVKILVEIMEDKLASKQDFLELRAYVEHRFALVDTKLENTIGQLESKLESSISQLESKHENSIGQLDSKLERYSSRFDSKLSMLESRLTIRMGTMFAASIAILTAIQKLT